MKNKKLLIGLNLILFLGYFIYSIIDKEDVLKEGNKVLLKLAPVDPRSIMQGDYMRLNYEMNSKVRKEDRKQGYIVVSTDSNQIGSFKRVQGDALPLNDGEYLIKYRKIDWGRVKIGAESFFFQEGKAKLYESAVYGCLRVDNDGNSVLAGLYSEDLKLIE